ncbi:hypothetical protein [Streptomyces albicerus]|uniref:hypothetical protein n=1 Tax=Streptomyces albicerus TaxID=2569859 RepID=UPI00124BC289|nr:hypothetical protein [Streptomyces albicerus]
MKIIASVALIAATLLLTAAVPASADGDYGTRQAGQQDSPSSVADSVDNNPMTINMEGDSDSDLTQGLLPRVVGRVL